MLPLTLRIADRSPAELGKLTSTYLSPASVAMAMCPTLPTLPLRFKSCACQLTARLSSTPIDDITGIGAEAEWSLSLRHGGSALAICADLARLAAITVPAMRYVRVSA